MKAAFVRSMIPRQIISGVGILRVFLKQQAHAKRLNGMPIDAQGKYIPWLTYPMLEFINGLDLSKSSVLEFGCGGSTLYWAGRAKDVTSIEMNLNWLKNVSSVAPANVNIIYEPDGHRYADRPLSLGRKFDVIVIDGAERYRSAATSLKVLAPAGLIILDNAEWYPRTAELLSAAGLIEVPFSGFPALNAFTSTSTAFLTRDFSIQRLHRGPPIGGRTLISHAFDDQS